MPTVQEAALQDAAARARDALGVDAYVLVEGEDKHFLAEAAMGAIASTVLAAFLRGFTDRLTKEAEAAGAGVADWLVEQVRRVLGREGEEPPLQEEAQAASAAAAAAPAPQVEAAADAAQGDVREALQDQGLTLTAAERVAAAVRQAGLQAVTA